MNTYQRSSFNNQPMFSRSVHEEQLHKADTPSHQSFMELLEALRQASHHNHLESDALHPGQKHALQRAILCIGAILADVRTAMAGELLPEIPQGCLASMEYEMISMDFRTASGSLGALVNELNRIHKQAEALHGKELKQPGYKTEAVA